MAVPDYMCLEISLGKVVDYCFLGLASSTHNSMCGLVQVL